MENYPHMNDLFKGFSKLSKAERFSRLLAMGALDEEDIAFLNSPQAFSTELAEKLIENVIGYFHMPFGVATNFQIDGQDTIIPMAVEETSIIAAASKTAKWIRETGSITTSVKGQYHIGQVQIAKTKDFARLSKILEEHKSALIAELNTHVASGLVTRGGGVADMLLRKIPRPDGTEMAVIHLMIDTCDAMGANIINQVCEYLKAPIEKLSGETVSMSILSNLNDAKLTCVTVELHKVEKELGEKIAEASLFAELDPYRAATHNKGVLNGMDAVLLATGNDWRAVEAGIHAYAARDGQYRSITQWRFDGNTLRGTLEAPITVGIVGGVTRLHPIAQISLKMLGIQSANELARIVAAVGLVQNLGALRALTTVGIVEGHMKLHITNLTLGAGAKETEVPVLHKRLEEILISTKRVTLSNAIEVLQQIRRENTLTSA